MPPEAERWCGRERTQHVISARPVPVATSLVLRRDSYKNDVLDRRVGKFARNRLGDTAFVSYCVGRSLMSDLVHADTRFLIHFRTHVRQVELIRPVSAIRVSLRIE